MNVNGQSTDNLADELHKIMSQSHQLMSQGNQVVDTSPGQSQKLFKTNETVYLAEKNECSHQRHNRQHNDGKVTSLGSLLGVPVDLSNGIAVKTKHKTTIKLTYTGVKWSSKLAVWKVLHGEQNLNSS